MTEGATRVLDRLHATEEIRAVIVRYARATDRARLDGLRTDQFFVPEALMEAPGRTERGLDVILARQRDELDTEEAPSQHTVTGTSVEVNLDAGIATAVSEFICVESCGDGFRVVLAGRYLDELTRAGDSWLIRRRRVVPLSRGPA